MNLIQQVTKLFSRSPPPPKPPCLSKHAQEFVTAASRVKESANAVTEQLQPFVDLPDPFGAFLSATWAEHAMKDRRE